MHGTNIWCVNFTLGYVPKRFEKWDWNTYLYTHIHTSIIHTGEQMKEAHQLSKDRGLHKHTQHSHSGIWSRLQN